MASMVATSGRVSLVEQAEASCTICPGPAGTQDEAHPGTVTRDDAPRKCRASGMGGGLPKGSKARLRHRQQNPRARRRQGRPQRGPA